MRAIFLSYRREDTEGQAGRLYDELVRDFGEGLVFMDVAGIDPGVDFRVVIDSNVSSCGVLLAMIGPKWLELKDDGGQRRLDSATDFVRLETAAALKRNIPVIPVLVGGARMPKPEQLPADLKDLAYRNAAELTHARWDSDSDRLIKKLRVMLGDPPGERSAKVAPPQPQGMAPRATPPKPPRPWRAAIVGLAVVAMGVGAYLTLRPGRGPPSIGLFAVTPDHVAKGTEVTISWEVTNAEGVELDFGQVQRRVQSAGALPDRPQSNTHYRIVASNSAGTVDASRDVVVRTVDVREPPPAPNFAGTWIELNPPVGGRPQHLQIVQNGFELSINGGSNVPVVGGTARWGGPMGCAPKFRHPGYNYDGPGAAGTSTVTISLSGAQLVYTNEWKWIAPCATNHPIGVESQVSHYERE